MTDLLPVMERYGWLGGLVAGLIFSFRYLAPARRSELARVHQRIDELKNDYAELKALLAAQNATTEGIQNLLRERRR